LYFEICKLICSVWKKEEISEEQKKSIILPIYKKAYEPDYSNYQGISFSPTSCRILSSLLLLMLGISVDSDISTTDKIIHICQIMKKWYSISAIYRVTEGPWLWREVLYNSDNEFGIFMKLFKVIKMCLNEMYSKICIGNHLMHFLFIWLETRGCYSTVTFQLSFRICF